MKKHVTTEFQASGAISSHDFKEYNLRLRASSKQAFGRRQSEIPSALGFDGAIRT
jgi:hypothetical protein